MAATRELGERMKAREAELAVSEARLHELLSALPNVPGRRAQKAGDWVVLREVGERPAFNFAVRDHVNLGVALDVIDIERAAKVSSSTPFAYLKGNLVLFELALVRYGLDAVMAHGFRPVLPPVLVRKEAREDICSPPDEQYLPHHRRRVLVGTSEVPLAGLAVDEFLEAEALPLRYAGFSTCFRREAGAAGKDTRGICASTSSRSSTCSASACPSRRARSTSSSARRRRGAAGPRPALPRGQHRRRRPGAPAAKKYDCEAWMPGQERYREVAGCSNCTDYQARGLNCRYRTESGPRFVHTLNGTTIAMGPTIIAIVENYQRGDGSVAVPTGLVPYVGKETIGARAPRDGRCGAAVKLGVTSRATAPACPPRSRTTSRAARPSGNAPAARKPSSSAAR